MAETDGRHGYQDAAEVSGRPLGEAVYWGALALAAGADVAAFHQVVSLVMRQQGDTLIWLMVLGFTATALTLAHFVGRLARDVTAGRGVATVKKTLACFGPWLMLGLTAFAVRLIVADSTSATSVGGVTVGGLGNTSQQVTSAMMFLALYLASGAITGFGAYLTHNPLRVGYRRALRAHRRALKRLGRSQPPHERAVQVYRLHARNRRREKENWQAARAQRLAFADELKRYAAVLIATHLQSPSATDGMTLPDRVPLLVPVMATAPASTSGVAPNGGVPGNGAKVR